MFLALIISAAAADGTPWDCPTCGAIGNTGNFCGKCGSRAPSAEAEAQTVTLTPGQQVIFGHYPQTAAGTSVSGIDWIVLDVRDGKTLLLSKYGLEARPYHIERTEITWEDCTLREWLNTEFFNAAFTDKERTFILESKVENGRGQGYSGWYTDGGNDTEDKVFLLSFAEANRYLGVRMDDKTNLASRAAPSMYAAQRGAYVSYNLTQEGENAGWWWLRSSGCYQFSAGSVNSSGGLLDSRVNNDTACVRPAIWVVLRDGVFE